MTTETYLPALESSSKTIWLFALNVCCYLLFIFYFLSNKKPYAHLWTFLLLHQDGVLILELNPTYDLACGFSIEAELGVTC